MNTVLAYFDPGSGSLLMQLLLGGVGGLAVFGKTLWQHYFARPRATETPESTTTR